MVFGPFEPAADLTPFSKFRNRADNAKILARECLVPDLEVNSGVEALSSMPWAVKKGVVLSDELDVAESFWSVYVEEAIVTGVTDVVVTIHDNVL